MYRPAAEWQAHASYAGCLLIKSVYNSNFKAEKYIFNFLPTSHVRKCAIDNAINAYQIYKDTEKLVMAYSKKA